MLDTKNPNDEQQNIVDMYYAHSKQYERATKDKNDALDWLKIAQFAIHMKKKNQMYSLDYDDDDNGALDDGDEKEVPEPEDDDKVEDAKNGNNKDE